MQAVLVGLFAFVAAAPNALGAEGERKLDPVLSLIGGCKAESLDPVEDPGCPGGTHPPSPFSDPRAVATDFYGNIYVSSFSGGSQGRIDIFTPEGVFVFELKVTGPTSLAIDSKGNLYVVAQVGSERPILRFAPCAPYDPEAGEISYCNPPVEVPEVGIGKLSVYTGIAINADNDHLFANFGSGGVVEFASAEEGNARVRTTPTASWPGGVGMAVDAARDQMYASVEEDRIDIFDLTSVVDGAYEKVGTIDGTEVPAGDFGTQLSVAVDEGTGHVFVFDNETTHLYEFDENGKYLTTIDFPFQKVEAGQIAVDNGPFSPNGALGDGAKGRYLYVPSHRLGTGHSFAFFESSTPPPVVKSIEATNIAENEAELQAQINPGNLETTYTFEYKVEGASTWTLAGKSTLPAGNLDTEASAAAVGLQPGTRYRFRVVATNEEGSDEAEGTFATYPSFAVDPNCPNALLRTGPSALLPDCRAYELVTPPDTNGRAPIGTGQLGSIFVNRQVSPAGDKVPFMVEGGSIPGLGGTGSTNTKGDPYLSVRTPAGWTTTYTGPSGAEATTVLSGTTSPDQGHSFWAAERGGSAVVEGSTTTYVRYPDGHSELLGKGSLGIDPEALGLLISEGGGHIIFATGAGASTDTAVQLEPDAAPDGTAAIYDRTPDGITHVVSLKPGDVSFGPGENTVFQAASLDGMGVAFEANGKLYLRYDNTETFEVGAGVEFAGIAEGGRRVFYMEGGDLKAFDVEKGVIEFTETSDAVPVIVAPGGAAAYFASETAITRSGPNPQGEEPQVGAQNLYLSREGQVSFVATVTDGDVKGAPGENSLDAWMSVVGDNGSLGRVPARTTPDGGVLLFKARAALGDYDPEGHAQIYRYDSAGELQCLSCNPTGAPASSDADLQSESEENLVLFYPKAWLENLRADGRRAFFESSEPLVARDSDGLRDVYEWEDNGVGSCTSPGGCLYLISSPQSLRDEYLWAVSRTGDDVFFRSSERLVGADADETPSIYDARVGGGFLEPVNPICEGEGCRPQPTPPPPATGVPTLVEGKTLNPRRCPKGKRKVKRAGKVRCVKKKKHRRHHRAGAKRGARR
jgi:hypothetical protein